MKKNKWIVIAAVMGMGCFSNILSAQTPKYLNSSLPTDERVSDLVSKLSLAQKIKLMQYTGTAVETNGLKIQPKIGGMCAFIGSYGQEKLSCFLKQSDFRQHEILP